MPTDVQSRLQMTIIALAAHHDLRIRAAIARVTGYLQWEGLYPITLILLYDAEWLVRANAAKALLRFPDLVGILRDVFSRPDRFAWDVLIRTLEQQVESQRRLWEALEANDLHDVRTFVLEHSQLLRLQAEAQTPAPETTSSISAPTPTVDSHA
jgi:hypothetical protein